MANPSAGPGAGKAAAADRDGHGALEAADGLARARCAEGARSAGRGSRQAGLRARDAQPRWLVADRAAAEELPSPNKSKQTPVAVTLQKSAEETRLALLPAGSLPGRAVFRGSEMVF